MKIAVLKGDGVGPDIVAEAIKVLDKVGKKFGQEFAYEYALIGGEALDATDSPLPQKTIDTCKNSDAVLLGAVGGPKWDNLKGDQRPEAGLLKIRKELGLFANIRPSKMHQALAASCLLKEKIAKQGIDIMILRELTGGIYFGKREDSGDSAYDTLLYSSQEVERIARLAFQMAKKRGNKVTSVDKANVLDSSRLWRRTVAKVHQEFPEVELVNMYVDNAAMQLVRDPSQFDVLVTGNMFGDILSDQSSMITGSIGMLPSASVGTGKFGLYEPIHGSAPDIAGQNKANPLATILSVAMMLRHSFDLEEEAKCIENAVTKVLEDGYRTQDIATNSAKDKNSKKVCETWWSKLCRLDSQKVVGTTQMGDLVAANI